MSSVVGLFACFHFHYWVNRCSHNIRSSALSCHLDGVALANPIEVDRCLQITREVEMSVSIEILINLLCYCAIRLLVN